MSASLLVRNANRRAALALAFARPHAAAASTLSAPTSGATAPEGKLFSQAKGPGALFLYHLVKKGTGGAYAWLYENYGKHKVVRVRDAFFKEQAVLFDVEDARHVHMHEGKYPEGTTTNKYMEDFFSGRFGTDHISLGLMRSGESWRRVRKALSPGIYTEAVASYEGVIRKAAVAGVDRLELYGPDNFARWCKCIAFDMFASLTIGRNPSTTDPECKDKLAELLELEQGALALAVQLNFTPSFTHPSGAEERMTEAFNRICDISAREIDEAFAEGKELPHSWFRDLIVEQGLTVEDVKGLIPGLLAAGIGTTQGVLQWMLISLARHGEAQEELREAIRTKLGPDPAFSRAKKKDIPELEWFLRETLRVNQFSSLSGMRRLEHDVHLPSGYTIPAGVQMLIAPFAFRADPSYVDNPETFDLGRYRKEAVEARKGCPMRSKLDHRVGKDPFGMGMRVCLGKRAAETELSTVLVELLRRYRVSLADPNTKFPLPVKDDTLAVPVSFPPLRIERL